MSEPITTNEETYQQMQEFSPDEARALWKAADREKAQLQELYRDLKNGRVNRYAPGCRLPRVMWFFVIKVPPEQGSGEYGGFLCMPTQPDTSGQPTKAGLCVFDSEDDAQRFIDWQEPDSEYEPTPLEDHSIALIVDNEEVGTPECIFYIGEYRDGEEVGADPLSSDEFLRTIEEG